MLATAPSVMAKPAGKVANQSQAEVAQSLTDTVTIAEETLAAMKSGADKDTVLALIKRLSKRLKQ